MSFGVDIAQRSRKCDWCPEKILSGQACLVYYDMGKIRAQLCEECTRKIYLIISKRVNFDFKHLKPHPDFLKTL